ncbi:hypothetical protein SAMN05518846_101189 [Brevibacillus centrosporus]|uniref:Uncharacterized protein n=1 Tax=Brevibacillus centrosporus TaxID=54910 RepID=A0A1I3L574_9BACL|nr:hypothetical protein SAMN05518846_101189 [Brevibacillus centrosporus]
MHNAEHEKIVFGISFSNFEARRNVIMKWLLSDSLRERPEFKVGKAYRIPKICVQEYVLKTIHKNIEQYKQQFK